MPFYSSGVPTHWVEFDAPAYRQCNEWPLETWGQTLAEIAQDSPESAYHLLCLFIAHHASMDIRFTVQTSTGNLSTESDLGAAQLAFLKIADRVLAGGIALEPFAINVTSLVPLADINTEEPTGERYTNNWFTISAEPPSFAA